MTLKSHFDDKPRLKIINGWLFGCFLKLSNSAKYLLLSKNTIVKLQYSSFGDINEDILHEPTNSSSVLERLQPVKNRN